MEDGTKEDEDMGPHEWPPDSSAGKHPDPKLLFLTVEYVGEEAGGFGGGEEAGLMCDLEQRCVSQSLALEGACYSPAAAAFASLAQTQPPSPPPPPPPQHQDDAVFLSDDMVDQQPSQSLITNSSPHHHHHHSSPSSSPLLVAPCSPFPPPPQATSVVTSSPASYVTSQAANYYRQSPRGASGAEYVLPGDGQGDGSLPSDQMRGLRGDMKVGDGVGQIELLLDDDGVALTVIDPQDSDVIQIPGDCLMPSNQKPSDIGVSGDETNFYDSIKPQGLVVETSENGELRFVSFLDTVETENQLEAIEEQAQSPMTLIIDETISNVSSPAQGESIAANNGPFWCEDCQMSVEAECSLHRVNSIICDKPVPSRARATLPASYLAINLVKPNVYGIFARKTIPNRTQFGPIEGILLKCEDVWTDSPLELLVETETGEMHRLDVSNEDTSNWMRFVQPASSAKEQNLVLSQQGHSLYFTSTRPIHPRQQLLVWYSAAYAAKRHLPQLLEPPQPPPVPEKTYWTCFECNQKFKSSEELQKHLNLHENERVLQEVRNYELMKTRSSSKRNGLQLALREKSQNIDDPPPPKKQVKSSSQQTSFECTACSRSFPRMYSLKRHLLLHYDKKFKCPHCSLEFSHADNRDKHVRKQHSDKCVDLRNIFNSSVNTDKKIDQQWLCKHCNLTFGSASVLNLHTLAHAADNLEGGDSAGEVVGGGLPSDFAHIYHNGEFMVENGSIQCPQCTKLFQTKRELVDHVSTHGRPKQEEEEEEEENGLENFPDENKFGCLYCTRSFDTADCLKQHSLTHVSTAVQCNVCFKRFLNNSALTGHLKSHAILKSFECPICKETFDHMLSLKAHVQGHANNGIFTCPHCKKEFDEYSQIRKHIRSFHCDRKFICEYCQKQFHTQDKLRMHKLKHSDHREFLCANCGKQFKRKDKLQEHMKRMHTSERDLSKQPKSPRPPLPKKFIPKVVLGSSDYERFIFKCHACQLGFKRRGMLVNHLANRHPDITPDSVPELNLPILKTTRDYYCQYCDKIYKSSSKRKAHILKNHPGSALPMSNRQKGGVPEIPGQPNPTFSQTVGSVTTTPHGCQWCHKQYASKAKLLQHQRKKHLNLLPSEQQQPRPGKCMSTDIDNQPAPPPPPLQPVIEPKQAAAPTPIGPQLEGGVASNAAGGGATAVAMATGPGDNSANAIALAPHCQLTLSGLTDTILTEYEIATGDTDIAETGIVIDAATLKRAIKSGDTLLSELSLNLGAYLSQEQCLKLIQVVADESLYSPYTLR
ncbi:PR domain zinc finger protein 10 isoform X2 [Nilaparvata lugens]|uniref:PR domain zinc finger protein 10 isoform X2 n=1 Tax=Nilaparvata lugens TaxID=108931 RepID=UPI00193DFE0B|nr:PR domain zinc finger protein 10 isoform X2 [Nilaparvata lugens]